MDRVGLKIGDRVELLSNRGQITVYIEVGTFGTITDRYHDESNTTESYRVEFSGGQLDGGGGANQIVYREQIKLSTYEATKYLAEVEAELQWHANKVGPNKRSE